VTQPTNVPDWKRRATALTAELTDAGILIDPTGAQQSNRLHDISSSRAFTATTTR
jgi:hypothetical protein